MGEPSEPIRRKVCTDLGFLGIELDPARNLAHETRISTDASTVGVFVLPTNEESAMASIAERIIKAPL
jgi:acetate kinase